MHRTKIDWSHTVWNPVTGCTPVEEGCLNCYARRFAHRLRGRFGYPEDEPFKVTLHPERLDEPLRWKKSRRVFVCSMGDLFHESVPHWFLTTVFEAMYRARHHTYLILTKRPQRMKDFLAPPAEPGTLGATMGHTLFIKHHIYNQDWVPGDPPHWEGIRWPEHFRNVWLGVSVENQRAANERIPILLQIPAAVRFVSLEPLLGEVDISPYLIEPSERICENCWQFEEPEFTEHSGKCLIGIYKDPYPNSIACHEFEDRHAWDFTMARSWLGRINWVIVGAETGPGARPYKPEWVESIIAQCREAGIPVFLKANLNWPVKIREFPANHERV